jgi:membrane protein implicated in regulation of membrane protease activity
LRLGTVIINNGRVSNRLATMIEMSNSGLILFLLGSISLSATVLVLILRKNQNSSRMRSKSFNGLIGSYGIMATDVTPDGPFGKVEVHGTLWNAEVFEPIPKGTRVIVAAQDNLNLIVQRVE